MKVILACLLLAPALAYKGFQEAIPNGDQVSHPCKPNYLWQGVGHLVPGGGGKRNPFGVDFYRNGKKWDKCLCEADSDGDGKTNGEELGDPDCTWTPGTVPKVTTGLSHPGICEPLDSVTCQVRNEPLGEICEQSDEIKPCVQDTLDKADTESWTIRFPPTPVPAEETVYVCQVFQFPDNETDYHATAYYPIIDNQHVMHHILVYGCSEDIEPTEGAAECGMAAESCRDLLFVWAVGSNGHCLNEEFGFRLGKTGYKTVLMQTHWNNPSLEADYTDSSGLAILYTPELRDNDGGMMMTGQLFLDIPPNQQDVVVGSSCSSVCTSALPHPIHVSDVLIHMHYLGNKGYIYHKRDNTTLTEFVVQDDYSYDSPVLFNYNPAVTIQPGDVIETICHFKSTSRKEYTYWGEGTSEEMCFGFLTYYPKVPGLNTCFSYLSADFCERPDRGSRGDDEGDDEDADESSRGLEMFLGCNQTSHAMTSEATWTRISELCDPTGQICTVGCKTFLDALQASDPCFRDDHLKLVKHTIRNNYGELGVTLLNFLGSCEEKPDDENRTKPDHEEEEDGHSHSHGHGHGHGALCAVAPSGGDITNPEAGDGTSGATTPTVSALAVLLLVLLLH